MKKKSLIETVSTTDANKNGCDIVMAEKNVRIEIKSTKPVNEGNKYSSIQRWSILNDAIKLKEGDHDNNFVKIIGLLDLGERTDDAVNTICKKTNSRTQDELRKKQNNIVSYLEKIEENIAVSAGDNSKIYLKKFKLQQE